MESHWPLVKVISKVLGNVTTSDSIAFNLNQYIAVMLYYENCEYYDFTRLYPIACEVSYEETNTGKIFMPCLYKYDIFCISTLIVKVLESSGLDNFYLELHSI